MESMGDFYFREKGAGFAKRRGDFGRDGWDFAKKGEIGEFFRERGGWRRGDSGDFRGERGSAGVEDYDDLAAVVLRAADEEGAIWGEVGVEVCDAAAVLE